MAVKTEMLIIDEIKFHWIPARLMAIKKPKEAKLRWDDKWRWFGRIEISKADGKRKVRLASRMADGN